MGGRLAAGRERGSVIAVNEIESSFHSIHLIQKWIRGRPR